MSTILDVPLAKPLIDRFGAEAVYEAGLAVSGAPLWMVPTHKEVLAIFEYLEKGQNDAS